MDGLVDGTNTQHVVNGGLLESVLATLERLADTVRLQERAIEALSDQVAVLTEQSDARIAEADPLGSGEQARPTDNPKETQ